MNQLQIDGTENIEVVAIGQTEARELTDKFRDRVEELWYSAIELYERGVHTALGYDSWGLYFEAEFGGKKSNAYRILDAGRVMQAIDDHSPMGERPTERQARELAPLARNDPAGAAEVWHEAIEEHGEDVTAANVRQVVIKRTEDTSPIWTSEEQYLAEQVLQGKTVVVNMRSEVHPRLIKWAKETGKFVKIDRRSEWGNPFEVPADGNRDTVIRNYEEHYLPYKPSLTSRMGDLKGKALGCWCAPEPCHGDILKARAEQ